jgi:hypothetical protein
MEKIDSFRKGNVWLNVFKTDDGQLLVTINKTYNKNGEWQSTSILNERRGDIEDLRDCLFKFHELRKSVNAMRGV